VLRGMESQKQDTPCPNLREAVQLYMNTPLDKVEITGIDRFGIGLLDPPGKRWDLSLALSERFRVVL
jgi:hypothetical protein